MALGQVQRTQIAGAPDLATAIPEAASDVELAKRNVPSISILVAYGAALHVIAYLVL